MTMTLKEWKRQLDSDKTLFLQSKHWKKHGGGGAVAGLVGYYGNNYRESLAGYKRALSERKKIKVYEAGKKSWVKHIKQVV